jgi:hypothetical protein
MACVDFYGPCILRRRIFFLTWGCTQDKFCCPSSRLIMRVMVGSEELQCVCWLRTTEELSIAQICNVGEINVYTYMCKQNKVHTALTRGLI